MLTKALTLGLALRYSSALGNQAKRVKAYLCGLSKAVIWDLLGTKLKYMLTKFVEMISLYFVSDWISKV